MFSPKNKLERRCQWWDVRDKINFLRCFHWYMVFMDIWWLVLKQNVYLCLYLHYIILLWLIDLVILVFLFVFLHECTETFFMCLSLVFNRCILYAFSSLYGMWCLLIYCWLKRTTGQWVIHTQIRQSMRCTRRSHPHDVLDTEIPWLLKWEESGCWRRRRGHLRASDGFSCGSKSKTDQQSNQRERDTSSCPSPRFWPWEPFQRLPIVIIESWTMKLIIRPETNISCNLFKCLWQQRHNEWLTGTRSGYFRRIFSPSVFLFSKVCSSLYWNFMAATKVMTVDPEDVEDGKWEGWLKRKRGCLLFWNSKQTKWRRYEEKKWREGKARNTRKGCDGARGGRRSGDGADADGVTGSVFLGTHVLSG